jgi:hypothetical protein
VDRTVMGQAVSFCGGRCAETTGSPRPTSRQPSARLAPIVLGVVGAVLASCSSVAQAALPDGRGWELVSPASKAGGPLLSVREGGAVIRSSEDGRAVTYVAAAPLGTHPEGSSNETQIVSERSAGDWTSQEIATPHDEPTKPSVGAGQEYRAFSPNLAAALVEPLGETPLAPEATEKTMYLRDSASGRFLPLVTPANVPPGTHFGNALHFVSGTPDLGHIVFESEVALTSTPITQQLSVYQWVAGQLKLISLLPNGEAAPVPSVGGPNRNLRHAVSDDGSRIVWSAQQHLYLRDTNTEETIQLDANQGAAEPGEGQATFQGASSDGSKTFFTDTQRLTADSTATAEGEERDLYEFDRASGKLTDLTVDHNPGESAGVQGLVSGISEDGSYVYFIADGVLASGATPGGCHTTSAPGATCNLYAIRYNGAEWTAPRLIAVLSAEDQADWSGNRESLGQLAARVSPNGRYLTFMSVSPLTGYANTDANTGQADAEVFLQDAEPSPGENPTVCVSCDPTGAPPTGVLDNPEEGLLIDGPGAWKEHWLAANIPGWTEYELERALYQPRYLQDSGRLFFNAITALVPEDANNTADVYEYEPAGVGTCAGSSERFNATSGGCVGLISSGTSGEESALLDASTNGGDVFFLTAAKLVPQDVDDEFDVYDAHECTAQAPCIPSPPAQAPPCVTAEACRPASGSQLQLGVPPTQGLTGQGNLQPSSLTSKKPLTRAQKLAQALRVCRHKAKRARRACESKARRKYGPRPVHHRKRNSRAPGGRRAGA